MKVSVFKIKNQEIFKSIKNIRWFDKEGVLDFPSTDIYISFLIDDVGVRDNYNGVYVSIYSKTKGLLKKKFFKFADYLNINHVWYMDRKFEWYTVVRNGSVNKPTAKELKDYCNEIQTYISLTTGVSEYALKK